MTPFLCTIWLKNELENLTTIDSVQITGIDEQEIQIVLKPEVIANYGIQIIHFCLWNLFQWKEKQQPVHI